MPLPAAINTLLKKYQFELAPFLDDAQISEEELLAKGLILVELEALLILHDAEKHIQANRLSRGLEPFPPINWKPFLDGKLRIVPPTDSALGWFGIIRPLIKLMAKADISLSAFTELDGEKQSLLLTHTEGFLALIGLGIPQVDLLSLTNEELDFLLCYPEGLTFLMHAANLSFDALVDLMRSLGELYDPLIVLFDVQAELIRRLNDEGIPLKDFLKVIQEGLGTQCDSPSAKRYDRILSFIELFNHEKIPLDDLVALIKLPPDHRKWLLRRSNRLVCLIDHTEIPLNFFTGNAYSPEALASLLKDFSDLWRHLSFSSMDELLPSEMPSLQFITEKVSCLVKIRLLLGRVVTAMPFNSIKSMGELMRNQISKVVLLSDNCDAFLELIKGQHLLISEVQVFRIYNLRVLLGHLEPLKLAIPRELILAFPEAIRDLTKKAHIPLTDLARLPRKQLNQFFKYSLGIALLKERISFEALVELPLNSLDGLFASQVHSVNKLVERGIKLIQFNKVAMPFYSIKYQPCLASETDWVNDIVAVVETFYRTLFDSDAGSWEEHYGQLRSKISQRCDEIENVNKGSGVTRIMNFFRSTSNPLVESIRNIISESDAKVAAMRSGALRVR